MYVKTDDREHSEALSQDALEATEKHPSRTLSPEEALAALQLLTAHEYGAAKSYLIIYPMTSVTRTHPVCCTGILVRVQHQQPRD